MKELVLDLRYLHFAASVARYGSFRRASSVLGVSQASISRRVLALEDRLGVPLFERSNSGSQLTPAGKAFLRDARLGAEKIASAAQIASKAGRAEIGTLKVGMHTPLSSTFLRSVMMQFFRRHRNVVVTFHRGTDEELESSISAGTVDVAFLVNPQKTSGFSFVPLWQEEVFVVLPNGHRLANKPRVSFHDVASERFVVAKGGFGPVSRRILTTHFSCLGRQPRLELHDVPCEDLPNLVALGFGLGLAIESVARRGSPGVLFKRIEGCGNLISGAVWLRSNQNPVRRRLVGLARSLSASSKVHSKEQNL